MSQSGNGSSQTPTLDVFILTFNAAKHLINVPVFANHLRDAFARNATTLPELLVFSIQEMAPLAHSFIGSYILNPYFQHYESAVNLAAAKFLAQNDGQEGTKDGPYTLMTTRNVGMTGTMLFARYPDNLQNLQSTEVSFGAGDMANKGAVGLRTFYSKTNDDGSVAGTELTFVSTHLAAMEWNLEKRNKNWEAIVSGLVFEDPKKFTKHKSPHPTPQGSEDSQGEAQALLDQDPTEKALHDISIYKPTSHLFVAGDLNYRISKTSPAADSKFPNVELESPNHFSRFLHRDQLRAEKAAGHTLHGLSEAEIEFAPTYKLDILPKAEPNTELARIAEEEEDTDQVAWTYAKHRWPGWCDRILYLDVPYWVKGIDAKARTMKATAYHSMPAVRSSDHMPVFLRMGVPMIEPRALVPPRLDQERAANGEQGEVVDPRIKLPFPIDYQSWEHRAQVKSGSR
ncbi:DNase I-like protein [Xylariomycetidae sp. FL2044]|nr:DNase I-like protein [Xylariomycetidae sp. FL2044]